MKLKVHLATTSIFFILVNTAYFWESKLGFYALLSMLVLIVFFVVLNVLLIRQCYLAGKEKFKVRPRNYLIVFMAFVLMSSFLFPRGLINFDLLEGDDLLIAQRGGVANCTTTLKLKTNQKFIQKQICFGIHEITGEYKVKGDTIFFTNISSGRDAHQFFKYAVIKDTKDKSKGYKGYLDLFIMNVDTVGVPWGIVKNNLHDLKKK